MNAEDADGRTAVELTYSVGGFIEGGFERIGPAVEDVLGEQLGRLERFVETGKAEPAGAALADVPAPGHRSRVVPASTKGGGT